MTNALPLTLCHPPHMPAIGKAPHETPLMPGDWCHAGVQQRGATSRMAETETCSMETLRHAIVTGLRSIKEKWHEIDTAFNTDIHDAQLPTEFEEINRLAGLVSAVSLSNDNDMLDIEKLITGFEMAIKRIYRSREAPWGTWRPIGSQKTVTLPDSLTPNAKAAHVTLTHMDRAVGHLLAILSAAQEVETKSHSGVHDNTLSDEARAHRHTVARAFAALGRLLDRSEVAVERYLSQSMNAIPRERRRWKTRIAILVGLSLLTVTLSVALFLMPPLLPTLVGLGLALKISAVVVGMLGTTNSIFGIVGYSRNRGWDDLTSCIARVRNLYRSIDGSVSAMQRAACSRETVGIGEKLEQVDVAVEHLELAQERITGTRASN